MEIDGFVLVFISLIRKAECKLIAHYRKILYSIYNIYISFALY